MNYNSAKILKSINILVGILIFVLSYLFVFVKLSTPSLWQDVRVWWNTMTWNVMCPLLVLMILLMFLNWGMETVKWRFLMQKVYPLSFFASLKSVLAGVCVSVIFPNRSCDFIGRAFILPQGYALKGTLVTWVGNIAQLAVTLFFGLSGLIYVLLKGHGIAPYTMAYIIGTIVLVILLSLILWAYFNIATFVKFLHRINGKWANKIADKLNFLEYYTFKELSIALAWSIGRYIVFVFQLYLALRLCSGSVPLGAALGISCVYFLFTTIIPTWVLSEIGVRASVAIVLFGPAVSYFPSLGLNTAVVIFPTILLWCVNMVLPAVLGSFSVLKLKLLR